MTPFTVNFRRQAGERRGADWRRRGSPTDTGSVRTPSQSSIRRAATKHYGLTIGIPWAATAGPHAPRPRGVPVLLEDKDSTFRVPAQLHSTNIGCSGRGYQRGVFERKRARRGLRLQVRRRSHRAAEPGSLGGSWLDLWKSLDKGADMAQNGRNNIVVKRNEQ